MAHQFRRNTFGNTSIMFGLASLPILLALGAAVDMISLNNTNTKLQAAVDGAAIAGATSKKLDNKQSLKATVETYLKTNDAFKKIESGAKVSQGIDRSNGSFVVTVEGKFKTSFMKLAGIPTLSVKATAAVGLGVQAMEVALVLDNTGSMAGSKLASLKTAAKLLITTLESNKTDYADLKFALVPFSKYVNVGVANAAAPWIIGPTQPATWNGCIGSQSSPNDKKVGAANEKFRAIEGDVCPTEITPLTVDTADIKAKIDAMVATGNTYIAAGVMWGWNVLDASEPFTEGKTVAQMNAVIGRKVMVVMTDGTNTASPLYPSHNGNDSKMADSIFATVCANVKDQQIQVFTILFEESSLVIKDLMRNCASSPGSFFDATSSAALVDAFTRIGTELSSVRLVQ